MAWVELIIAGVFEMVWATTLKYSEGFTKLWPSLITIAAMLVSLWLLASAMKTIPIGTAYAAWTGIGAVGVAIFGMAFMGDPKTAVRIFCLVLIIAGVVGLKVFGAAAKSVS